MLHALQYTRRLPGHRKAKSNTYFEDYSVQDKRCTNVMNGGLGLQKKGSVSLVATIENIKKMKQEKRNFRVNKAFVSFETSRSTIYV